MKYLRQNSNSFIFWQFPWMEIGNAKLIRWSLLYIYSVEASYMHQRSSSAINSVSAFPDPATASNVKPFVTFVALWWALHVCIVLYVCMYVLCIAYPPDSHSFLRPHHRRNSQKEGSLWHGRTPSTTFLYHITPKGINIWLPDRAPIHLKREKVCEFCFLVSKLFLQKDFLIKFDLGRFWPGFLQAWFSDPCNKMVFRLRLLPL